MRWLAVGEGRWRGGVRCEIIGWDHVPAGGHVPAGDHVPARGRNVTLALPHMPSFARAYPLPTEPQLKVALASEGTLAEVLRSWSASEAPRVTTSLHASRESFRVWLSTCSSSSREGGVGVRATFALGCA